MEDRVNALLSQMTLEEKVGQLNQYASDRLATGPVAFSRNEEQAIVGGHVGSVLNVMGAQRTREFQAMAMRSRLRIPLLFGLDVIHGYRLTFPIPLAEAGSFDLAAIEGAARVAACEAAAGGIHWTFAPMVDITRDPRWGRVMEGAGEDPYLASRVATARVKGFQGRRLGDTDAVMATAKHFAAYGAAEGGRDYNTVDMSERKLWEVYLPPFKAALDAGVATFMNAFNDLNGVPANGSRWLQRDILKGQWGFEGFVVSDWGSVGEMVAHGYVKDKRSAAQAALTAGSDMDMESNAYREHLADLVRAGLVPLAQLEDAVRRVLRKKFELGLFEDPYRFSDPQREALVLQRPEHRQAARDMAAKSIVLLKNEGGLLPLSPRAQTVAFIGPLVKAVKANHGAWSLTMPGLDYEQFIVTQWQGLLQRMPPGSRLLYALGCDVEGERRDGFAQALAVAQEADVVVLSVGEHEGHSGEAKSRAHLGLPGVQEDLVKALHATGKPLVVLINAGRPLVFNWTAEHAHAVLYTWWLGSEAGNALADVLFGDQNPSARLVMSFPRSEGQIPLYYNRLNTGRPAQSEPAGQPTLPVVAQYASHYIDEAHSPRFAFGHGLSYSSFEYSDLLLQPLQGATPPAYQVSFTLANTSSRDGDEVVQLYLRDLVASVVRPVMELKDFRKVRVLAGQSQRLSFVLGPDHLAFFNAQLQRVVEPGEFELMIGASSADIRLRTRFEWVA